MDDMVLIRMRTDLERGLEVDNDIFEEAIRYSLDIRHYHRAVDFLKMAGYRDRAKIVAREAMKYYDKEYPEESRTHRKQTNYLGFLFESGEERRAVEMLREHGDTELALMFAEESLDCNDLAKRLRISLARDIVSGLDWPGPLDFEKAGSYYEDAGDDQNAIRCYESAARFDDADRLRKKNE
jgi:hypothetical protein